MMGLIERVIVPALVIFLLLGGSASTLLGLALVFRPEKALAFMRSMNRWVSTRRALKQAEIPRSVDVSSRKGRGWLALFPRLGGGFPDSFPPPRGGRPQGGPGFCGPPKGGVLIPRAPHTVRVV